MPYLWTYLAILNVVAYALMAADKARARRGARRIRERTLLLAAAAGGSAGAWIAMRKRRHKTRHAAFAVGIPAFAAVHAAILLYILSQS